MPNAFRQGRFRFFFYSNEANEPPHIHVEDGEGGTAKFWLDPIEEATVSMKAPNLRAARKLLRANMETCREKWNEHFRLQESPSLKS